MKTEEPEPIDWSIWGVKTPHEVRMANLQKAHDWEMENQTKVHAAEMADFFARVVGGAVVRG